ncbi:NCS2 family permease [Clostridium septicum]|uniref:NCS2 family permease n=1 Tax=Clostridium septicum TaxID=1504 RepID=A0A9N7JJ12_CLOSE|nr:NCS2 family permease [Clostridium septicum]AYE33130.1 NCS2 family permease [Clostridium septicum]QAS61300.1 NCS2 family permease [Clostridium septicum]UEC19348.1 NCS2 family permease [Clostridium septicum]USR99699.1 NCS2 family permease [Clostridium septicum]WLF68213.1 NCS2 family permease [Clostridium septicum]
MENLSIKEQVLPILTNKNVNFKKEIVAGITTFLTMAYIIVVNPNILSETGMPAGPLVTATCLSAAFGCILMGLFANLPFALASGMGLNAFFAFSVVLGQGISWEMALTAVFVEGIIFILLSLFKVREAVVNAIPVNMKHSVTAGIGIFIAFIGLVGCGLVVNDDATLVAMGEFTPAVVIALVGVVVIAVLDKKQVRGSILFGILISTLLAWGFAFIKPEEAANLGMYLPSGVFKFESIAPIAGKLDFGFITSKETIGTFIAVVCTFLFVDFFDTVGTLVGVASRANMLDEEGKVPNVGKALLVDAVATTAGAAMGVSTVTTYVESSTGVAAGGKTGYTAIVTGILFLISMFFSPIFISIPACATAPALIYVGYLMLGAVKNINFDNITEGVPAFLTIITMALTYSIGDGLTVGILSYVIINVLYNVFFANKEEKVKISWVMISLAVIFILKIAFLG